MLSSQIEYFAKIAHLFFATKNDGIRLIVEVWMIDETQKSQPDFFNPAGFLPLNYLWITL